MSLPHLLVWVFLTAGYGILFTSTTFSEPEKKNPPYQESHLSRGIGLYSTGQYDDALAEFNSEAGVNHRSPLSYYYAARIRLMRGQYSRAHANLLTALRDSTEFADARGLLAYTLKEMGETEKAQTEWKRFTALAGTIAEGKVPPDSIMLPEQYREMVKNYPATQVQNTVPVRASQPPKKVQPPQVLKTGKTSPTAPLPINSRSLDKRIKVYIWKGIYGIIGLCGILILILLAVILWLRHRTKAKRRILFDEEVSRVIKENPSLKGTSEETDGERGHIEEVSYPDTQLQQGTMSEVTHKEDQQSPHVGDMKLQEQTGKTPHPITEEIKVLVTRLYREGHSIEDIARIAELTTTEISLIVAVRTREMDHLVSDVTHDINQDTDMRDRGLSKVISELSAEGYDATEIARRLGITIGEVDLALSLKKPQKNK